MVVCGGVWGARARRAPQSPSRPQKGLPGNSGLESPKDPHLPLGFPGPSPQFSPSPFWILKFPPATPLFSFVSRATPQIPAQILKQTCTRGETPSLWP